MWLRPETSARACVFGTYPTSLTTLQTRSASSGATVEIPFTVRETVAIETPARCATSRMLAVAARRGFGFFLGPPISKTILRDFSRVLRQKVAQRRRIFRVLSAKFSWLRFPPSCARVANRFPLHGKRFQGQNTHMPALLRVRLSPRRNLDCVT